MCLLRACLLVFTVLLFVSKNEAERCRTNSFYNAQMVVYNTDHLSVIISVSGCISPVTLRGIGGNVRRVLCSNQHIPFLREQAVSSLSHLETIRFEKSAITTIMTGAFTNLSSLRNVYLTENQLESLNEDTFVDVPKLKVLSLYKNNLEHFDRSWLGNVSQLDILDLSYNVIEFIAKDTFLNLKTLRVLHIEHNNIRHITEKAFDELKELETLDLSYNKIGRLYDNLFGSTKQLSRLNLFGNSLTHMPEKVLRNLRTVDELILLYNPWQCECFDKIVEWNAKFETVKLNSEDLICEKTTDISSIAVCVTSNETRCVQNPKEDLVDVFFSQQPDYLCSLIKPYGVLKERDDPCTTPNGKAGRCVPLDNCQVVFDATITRKKEDTDFAKKSFCSFDTEALVCCESPGPGIAADFESKVLPDRATCGLVTEEPRIIEGVVTHLGEFPWMAALEYKSKRSGENGGIRCGGSLITNQYVLTAAHCVIHRELEVISVRLGEWKISTDPDCVTFIANTECADLVQNVKIRERIPHFFYDNKNGFNDIALLLLEKEVKFTDYIKPICLPSLNVPSPDVGTLMTIAGWGTTELGGELSDVLIRAVIPLISNDRCSSKFKSLSPQQLCAGGERKDGCQGDSGGPIMIIVEDKVNELMYWYQEGISSRGKACGLVGYPSVYTQVFSYMNWIINVLSHK